jgi:hypothetical protein
VVYGDALMQIILCDIDSTLSNTEHRHHLVPEDRYKGNWMPFALACRADGIIESVAFVVRMLAVDYPIFLVSGRNSIARDLTTDWLEKHNIPYDNLRLYEPLWDDEKENAAFKVAHAPELRNMGYDPVLMIDDWPSVADAMEAIGIPTLLVTPPYVDNPMKDYHDSYTRVGLDYGPR